MISKNDCILLLTDIQKTQDIDTSKQIQDLFKQADTSIDIIKFINNNRQLDVTAFYEKLRRSYNNKKSNLYINIVKEIEDPNDVLITLSAMETQILLFSKNVSNKAMFLRHSRAEDISLVLNNYFKTYDIQPCLRLLRLVKADLKVLEYVSGRESA